MEWFAKNKHDWHRWFAWYPVRVDDKTIIDKPHWAWFKFLDRQLNGSDIHPYYVYRNVR